MFNGKSHNQRLRMVPKNMQKYSLDAKKATLRSKDV